MSGSDTNIGSGGGAPIPVTSDPTINAPPGAKPTAPTKKAAGVDTDLTVGKQEALKSLNTGVFHELEKPQTLSAVALMVSTLSAKLQETRGKSAENAIKAIKKRIKDLNKMRADQQAKVNTQNQNAEKKQKVGKILGWLGTALGALVTAASLGTLSSAGVALMTVSLAAGIAAQAMSSSPAMAKMMEKDPKGAQALTYSLMAFQVVTAILAAKVSTVAEVTSELADDAVKTGAQIGKQVVKGADDLVAGGKELLENADDAANDLMKDCLKLGKQMADCDSPEEASELLVNRIDDMVESVNLGKVESVGDEVLKSGDEVLKSGDELVDDAAKAKEASGSGKDVDHAAKTGKDGKVVEKEAEPEKTKLDKAADGIKRASGLGQIATAGASFGNKMTIAEIDKQIADLKSELKLILADQGADESALNDMADQLKKIMEDFSNAMSIPIKVDESVYQSETKITQGIGNTGTGAV